MTPILIGACDCASPAFVTIAARTRATRTIHRVTIGRLLRDGEGWQGEYPRPPVAQARRFADAGFAGIFFVETRGEGSAMRVQVQKWGNSLALRIPKPFAEEAAMREGSVVNLAVARGRLVATPVTRNVITLRQLLRRVTRDNVHGEIDSGGRRGREAW